MMGGAPDGKRLRVRAFHCSCRYLGETRFRTPAGTLRTAPVHGRPRVRTPDRGHLRQVFVFFSSRLGCFGSLLVSAVLTLLLLLVLGVL